MSQPSRNVEIKARVDDFGRVYSAAKSLSDADEKILKQEDHFFYAPTGRLKLRFCEGSNPELIFYERSDKKGPKLCSYSKSEVSDGEGLLKVLRHALGVKGSVKKVRHLFMVGTTRIHLDEVECLGQFIELEVVLEPSQTSEYGEIVAHDLLKKLGIPESDLLSNAYMDLILSSEGTPV